MRNAIDTVYSEDVLMHYHEHKPPLEALRSCAVSLLQRDVQKFVDCERFRGVSIYTFITASMLLMQEVQPSSSHVCIYAAAFLQAVSGTWHQAFFGVVPAVHARCAARPNIYA
jgi:hypothetical protein